MNFIYLDNASTTKVDPEIVSEMANFHINIYGNPSSSHCFGIEAARALDGSRERILEIFGKGWEIIFTSCGTEANNMAILGYLAQLREKKIVTTSIEHSSIIEPCRFLEGKNAGLNLVQPEPSGVIKLQALKQYIDSSTFIVSIQHANNEIGTIQPVEEIGEWLKKNHPEILFHVDAVQSIGKISINEIIRWADMITISAHKFHGPKGIGALLIKKSAKKPQPLIRGGGQQGGLRSGTENVPGAVAMAESLKKAIDSLPQTSLHLRQLEETFDSHFRETSRAKRLYKNSPHLPGFIVVGFEKIPSEVIEHSMENEGIIISSGAACSSRKKKRSHVLEAIGLNHNINVIRIVPSRETTHEEMKKAATHLDRILKKLL